MITPYDYGLRVGLLAVTLAGCSWYIAEDEAGDSGPADAFVADSGPPACSGTAGAFRETLVVAGETRYYSLFVPDDYDCDQAWPLLVDLHGVVAGLSLPEEAYGLAAARSAAQRHGYLLVRPRSRAAEDEYRWDANPGDPQRNAEFLLALVADLGGRYHLDPNHRYLSGFSSGTDQVAVMMADPTPVFSGFGFFGGGAWTVTSLPTTSAPVFLATGFRDYMRIYQQQLIGLLDAAAHPAGARLIRDANQGHETYEWMYDEMWRYLDRGERPPPGVLTTGWSAEDTTTAAPLTSLYRRGGEVWAGGARILVRRSAAGVWSRMTLNGTPSRGGTAFTGLCSTTTVGIAVGNGDLAVTSDGGATWQYRAPLPDNGSGLGYGHLNDLDCAADRAVAGGYWTGRATSDGVTWTPVAFDYVFGRAEVTAVRRAPWGTWLAAGYSDYLGRSTDGASFTPVALPGFRNWLYDVAAVTDPIWVAVGDHGNILRSVDDGRHFTEVMVGAENREPLHRVSFSGLRGLAVGRRCAAYLTEDGGQTWSDVSCGLDLFLGATVWLADGTALVVGGRGAALRFDPEQR